MKKSFLKSNEITAAETGANSDSSSPKTPATISSKDKSTRKSTSNLGTLSTSKVLMTNETNLTRTMEPKLETIFSNYSSATTNLSEATLQAGSNELPGNSTTLAPSKKNDSIKLGESSKLQRK